MDIIVLLTGQEGHVTIVVESLLQVLDHSGGSVQTVDALLELGPVHVQVLDTSIDNRRELIARLHLGLFDRLLQRNTKYLSDGCQ